MREAEERPAQQPLARGCRQGRIGFEGLELPREPPRVTRRNQLVRLAIQRRRGGSGRFSGLLEYIAPNASKPPSISILTRKGCPHCLRAKGLLRDAGLSYEELLLNRDYTDRSLRAIAAANTFPQIFIDGEQIGGADELEQWLAASKAA